MRRETCAYIAGFLDGDGSIIFQIVRRPDYRLGFQIRASVCFYQKSSGRRVLTWLKDQFGVGYIRDRGTMSDYTIVGVAAVGRLLELVGPFTVAKREQVRRGLEILGLLRRQMTPDLLLQTANLVDGFSKLNYSKNKKISADAVREFLKHSIPTALRVSGV